MKLLDTNYLFSPRFVFDDSSPCKLRSVNTLYDFSMRIIFWIFRPAFYSNENRRAIVCFRKYLIDHLGIKRYFRLSQRYSINLEKMKVKGSLLLDRDIAKFIVGAQRVTICDLNEEIQKRRSRGELTARSSFKNLNRVLAARLIKELSEPFKNHFSVSDITQEIRAKPIDVITRFFYDRFYADREIVKLIKENSKDSLEVFMHNMVAKVIKKELKVGAIISAPEHKDGGAQFYYVSAKLVTGNGMVSYLLHPLTSDTSLEPIRLFRGTSLTNGELDTSSTIITDLEPNIGETAFRSGMIYEPVIQRELSRPKIEAGHSLGSTITQYRCANMDHIECAYLYSGPGLPMREVEKFNRKNPNIKLVVRITSKDPFRKLGDAHLGFQVPENVQLDLKKIYPPKEYRGIPHTMVWGKSGYKPSIEKDMTPERRDGLLYYKNRPQEKVRATIGPHVAKALTFLKHFFRPRIKNRTYKKMGLKIGKVVNGSWKVEYFRAM